MCGVLLVYCELPGYTITNIKAAYTNRITDQCSNSSIQNSEITCFNNITALLNARCLGQLVCVVEVNSTLHASGCQRSGYIEMSYECKPQGNSTNDQDICTEIKRNSLMKLVSAKKSF